jgi:hypothetical protein
MLGDGQMRRLSLVLVGLCVTLPAAAPATEPAKDTAALSARIDRLLAARWAEAEVRPVGPSDDAEFLRRAYLDLTGTVPPVAEVRRFLKDTSPDKRRALVDGLLDGPGYVRYFSAVWRELLVPDAEVPPGHQAARADLERWLNKQFADNAPFDKITRAILTLSPEETRPRREEDGDRPSPRLFYLGRDDKPEELAANVTRLFLGVRLECAQCHDHPHARWKRDDFWSQAAFFAKTGDKHDLAIPGAGRTVAARFLDGSVPPLTADSRTALADWVTAPKNPYFARALANRLWAHFFGVGLVDPVDDMTTENAPSHPELLDELGAAFVAGRYDVKFLIRALMLSDAYALTSAETRPGPAADPRLFSRMNVKALGGGEVFDSLIEATGCRGPDLPRQRVAFVARYAHMDRRMEGRGSIPQSLSLMNGRLLADALKTGADNTLSAVAESPFLDTAGKVEALFLAALGRPPRPEERDRFVKYVTEAADRSPALGDVFWALLNSAEFSHNH